MAEPFPGPVGLLAAAVGPLAALVAVAGCLPVSRPRACPRLARWLAFGWIVALAWGRL